MPAALWFVVGLSVGAISMLPIIHALRRRNARRARFAQERAVEAERLAELGSMTSGLAHEIKNPLSTISLNAQLLSEGIGEAEMASEERSRLVKRVDALRREIERLGGILNDFLQFAGRLRLDAQPRDVVKLVDELADFYHPQCDQAGIVLRTALPAQPVIVRMDERLAKQAILNLMINATQAMSDQHRDDRPRELMVRVEQKDDEARIHVTDTGPGIDAERLKTVFRPFISSKPGGTGLGLPTARRIVHEHGGRIDVHSEAGQGTDFVICLPLSKGIHHGGTEVTEGG
ncbi:MAG: sensor histidine kinase [Planctomycetota bacterium]|jgi:signal transduction histidine kinase